MSAIKAAAGVFLTASLALSNALAAPLTWNPPSPFERLVGPFASAGHAGSSGRGGLLIGVDAGWLLRLSEGDAPAASALSFSARVGFAFRSGASIDVAYDNFGLPLRSGAAGNLQAFSLGARYELLFLPVVPFAEVRLGPAFEASSLWPAGAVGAGLAFPLARQLRVQLTARDWLVPADDSVRSLFSVLFGLEVRI